MSDFQLEVFKDSPKFTSRLDRVNPMVIEFGELPGKHRCKECELFFVGGTGARGHYKCKLRGNTSGPGTDHRANWEACTKFKP